MFNQRLQTLKHSKLILMLIFSIFLSAFSVNIYALDPPAAADVLTFNNEQTITYYKTLTEDVTLPYTNGDTGIDVTIYKDAIGDFDYTSPEDGMTLKVNTPLFSIITEPNKTYTVETSVSGDGYMGFFSDAACDNELSAEIASVGPFVYESNSYGIVYYGASITSSLGIKKVTITVENSLPDYNYRGSVTGIDETDTNTTITFTSSIDTKTVTPQEYKTKGVDLFSTLEYTVLAKGDKGVYKSGPITVGDSPALNYDLSFERIEFDFPLNFTDNYADYVTYFNARGTDEQTDPYSSITVNENGILWQMQP